MTKKSFQVIARSDFFERKGDAMLTKYLANAMRKAHYEFLENDKQFYGEIPVCKGVYATGKTLEECWR